MWFLVFVLSSSNIPVKHTDLERYRAGQLQAERMLEAREQSHRQQIHRLENQVKLFIQCLKLKYKIKSGGFY